MSLKSILLVSAFGIVGAAQANIVISQVYGGGGSGSGALKNDYVELLNASTSAASLSGLSLQYGSAQGNFGSAVGNFTLLNDVTLNPGQYYLLKLGSTGTGGVDTTLTPDQVGGLNLSGTAGKLALYRGTTNVNALDLDPANVLDLVGYGATANRFEGSAAAPATTTANLISRGNFGLTDTGQNSLDFTASAATAGSFRNTTSAAAPVPEPASMAALGLGAAAMLRRRRAAK